MAKLKKQQQQQTSRKSTASAAVPNFYGADNGGAGGQMASLVSALAAANPSLYLNPLGLINSPLVAAALLQQQMTAAAAAATPAAVVKSRSVSSESASMAPPPPSTSSSGLKLVLKRQSGDKYEVKPPPPAHGDAGEPAVTSSSSSGRPKREASRRVKFTFNEYETDSSDYSPDKKRHKLAWSSSMPSAVAMTPLPFSPLLGAPFRSFSSASLDPSQQLLFQKPPAKPRAARRNPPAVQPEADLEKTGWIRPCVQQLPAAAPKVGQVSESEEDEEEEEQPVLPFHPSEIVRRTFSEKVNIVLHQPKVHLRTSRPFQIVLVESKSNIICTKALLYIHLFQSYTAQCITCLTCGDYLTIGEFSKHLHQSEDEEDDAEFAERLKQTFKVLPYRGKDKLELNEHDLETWKLFGIRYAKFKQEHLARLKQLKEDEQLKLRSVSTSNDERPGQFKNWDQVSDDRTLFMIDKSKLIYNEVVVSSAPLVKRGGGDRLSDHEDEDSGMDTDENETTKTPESRAVKTSSLVDDLSLSEDESESTPVPVAVVSRTDTIETQILSSSSDTTAVSDQTATPERPRRRLPSKHEKYINFYDNMSQANLMYICDNEFTIIPDSYVDYINAKRQSNQRNIKLAETRHFQKIWLSMCLDLELECRRVPSRRRCVREHSVSSTTTTDSSKSSSSSSDTGQPLTTDKGGLESIDELTTTTASDNRPDDHSLTTH